MNLHELALEIGIEINHSTYDTLYLAFAVAMRGRGGGRPVSPFDASPS